MSATPGAATDDFHLCRQHLGSTKTNYQKDKLPTSDSQQ